MQTIPSRDAYDVIVAGGGPAGSTVATLLAREGRDVLVLDREKFPRFRVGESLMPATYWTFERLGVLDKMKQSDFVKKCSVQFVSGRGRVSSPFYFTEFDPHDSSTTWQVDRARFDSMLLEHSAETGAEVCLGANVKDVLFEGSQAVGARVLLGDGVQRELRSRVVVDATGQTGMIARKLKLKHVDPKLRHAAIFTRYRGGFRDGGIDEGATLILQTRDGDSWFWYIPLPDDQISVGVVGPIDYLLRQREGSHEEIYDEELDKCPALSERLATARQTMDLRVLRDFSYVSERIAGDGWVLAGDAFGFLDPIYSTGVFLALKSAEFAADAIRDAFANGDFSGSRLGQNGDRYLQGMESMRKLVYAFYDRDFSFPEFLRRHPECRQHVVDLLVGNVYRRPVDGLFEAMGEMIRLPRARAFDTLEARR